MMKFIASFIQKILGVLSCFDRVIFRGHLPLGRVDFLRAFLSSHDVLYKDFKQYAPRLAERLKEHAQTVAAKRKRPYIYLDRHVRKEKLARDIAARDGVGQGLICVMAAVEPCSTFALRSGEGRPRLEPAQRKCLFLYYYFLDRDFGFMHVRIQTWLPCQIQIYVNGHDWLARKMTKHGIQYEQQENCFLSISDTDRAQKFADRFVGLKWPRILATFANLVNPLLADEFQHQEYYWVTDQAEFATDVMFRDRASLQSVYPKLLRHSTLSFSAEDILTFLGRKLHPQFAGEVHTDCKERLPGARVKHRMKENWIKMYDKHERVLRIETVINNPREFKVRRKGKVRGETVTGWFPMAKGVSNLYRYAEVSLLANKKYLDALAAVQDPEPAHQFLDKLCRPARYRKRNVKGFNPLAKEDVRLFAAVMRGEHIIGGFMNKDLQRHLYAHTPVSPAAQRSASARTTRQIQRLRAHGLVSKVRNSRRYRVTENGSRLIAAAIHLREEGMLPYLSARCEPSPEDICA